MALLWHLLQTDIFICCLTIFIILYIIYYIYQMNVYRKEISMGKLGGKIRNTATYAASKTFSEDYIKKQSLSGEHNGEPMMRVAQRIMSDPHVDMEPQSKNNKVYDLVYNDENKGSIIVGWAE